MEVIYSTPCNINPRSCNKCSCIVPPFLLGGGWERTLTPSPPTKWNGTSHDVTTGIIPTYFTRCRMHGIAVLCSTVSHCWKPQGNIHYCLSNTVHDPRPFRSNTSARLFNSWSKTFPTFVWLTSFVYHFKCYCACLSVRSWD